MIPDFIYGTAWKEDATERLTRLAIETGLRGIDTANQRRHYFEAAAGAAIASAIASGVIRRDELFIQTKFTYQSSQDHRLPYDPRADPPAQVQQSFDSSLDHLRTNLIDSYLLHGLSTYHGLASVDKEVWRAMEELHASGKALALGISNVSLDQIEELWTFARVKPSFVQNRCFARTRWDSDVRTFCRRQGIAYQGFSLLTANVKELQAARFRQIVTRVGKTPAQVVFGFALQAGMLPLTGTTNMNHMREDLESRHFTLSAGDLQVIENIAA